MQYTYSSTSLIHIPILKPIGDGYTIPCLWFLLCSKSSMLCSIPTVILSLYIYPHYSLLVMKTQSTVSGFCYALNRVCNLSIYCLILLQVLYVDVVASSAVFTGTQINTIAHLTTRLMRGNK